MPLWMRRNRYLPLNKELLTRTRNEASLRFCVTSVSLQQGMGMAYRYIADVVICDILVPNIFRYHFAYVDGEFH